MNACFITEIFNWLIDNNKITKKAKCFKIPLFFPRRMQDAIAKVLSMKIEDHAGASTHFNVAESMLKSTEKSSDYLLLKTISSETRLWSLHSVHRSGFHNLHIYCRFNTSSERLM